MRPVKLNDLHAGMQWIPTGTRTEQYFALLRSSEVNSESVNPGLVRGFGNLPLNFNNQESDEKTSQEVPVSYVLRVIHSNSQGRRCHYHC